MILKSVIIDDEKKHRETITMLLETYCPTVDIVAEAKDRDSLLQAIDDHQPDLIFMDIDLGGTTAFEILNQLDQINFKIVFVTASASHAITGYQYNAIDYLLKPIEPKKLIQVVERVASFQPATVSKEIVLEEFRQLYGGAVSSIKISVSDAKGVHVLKVNDIMYCQSSGNYTTFSMKDRSEIIISKNLKYFETKLEVYNFVRIHKSYLVNIDHIQQILKEDDGMVLLSDETSLPLAKTHKKQVLEKLNML